MNLKVISSQHTTHGQWIFQRHSRCLLEALETGEFGLGSQLLTGSDHGLNLVEGCHLQWVNMVKPAPGTQGFWTLHVMGRNWHHMCKFISHPPYFCLDLSELWRIWNPVVSTASKLPLWTSHCSSFAPFSMWKFEASDFLSKEPRENSLLVVKHTRKYYDPRKWRISFLHTISN